MDDATLLAPSDIEAERRTVGACLLSATTLEKVMLRVSPEDFFCAPYSWAFRGACELHAANEPINIETVIRKLSETPSADGKRSILTDVGGPAVFVEAITGVNAEEGEFWAERVQKKRAERDLLNLTNWARERVLSGSADVEVLRGEIEQRLTVLAGRDGGADTTTVDDDAEVLGARITRYIMDPDAITGLTVGWHAFDRMVDGLQPGNVSILYAQSSRFKSMVAANIAYKVAWHDAPVLFFTTEMPKLQVQERMLGLDVGLNFRKIRQDGSIVQYRREIEAGIRRLRKMPIYYNDRSDPDMGYLRAEVLRRAKWNDVKLVIVDLVDMVATRQYADDSVAQQSAIMRQMKVLAKTAKVHILLVSHVSKGDRATRGRADLDVEEMKGSSSKYQDVDTAISCMPVTEDPETGRWRGMTREEITYNLQTTARMRLLLSVTKNRHGELGQIPFIIDMNHGGQMEPLSNDKATYVQQGLPTIYGQQGAMGGIVPGGATRAA